MYRLFKSPKQSSLTPFLSVQLNFLPLLPLKASLPPIPVVKRPATPPPTSPGGSTRQDRSVDGTRRSGGSGWFNRWLVGWLVGWLLSSGEAESCVYFYFCTKYFFNRPALTLKEFLGVYQKALTQI